MRPWLVARITFLEALRKKDFYVLLILMGLYALFAATVLPMRKQDERIATLLFSLGLAFSFASAAILVVVLAARQLPKEIEQGTILPLLARPLTRWQLLWGKFLACWLVGLIALACFAALIRLIVPAPRPFSEMLFVQTLLLKAAGLGALAALTIMLSLFVPEALNIMVSAGYYFLWGLTFNIVQEGLRQLGGLGSFLARALYVFPRLEALNLSRVCLDQAEPLAWVAVFSLLAYAAAYAAIALLAAHNLFEKRWV
ncbi:ABC transporter permease [Candidatus Sumerlaeota bacterium]|nr:ABC transporter permease [Candidatus Sumerlaeota bacterium]